MIKRRNNKIIPMTIEDKKLPDSGYYIDDEQAKDIINKLNGRIKK